VVNVAVDELDELLNDKELRKSLEKGEEELEKKKAYEKYEVKR